jgi:hypothetical protein
VAATAVLLLAALTGCERDRQGSVIPGSPESGPSEDGRAASLTRSRAGLPTAAGGVPEAPERTDLSALASSRVGVAVLEKLVGPETVIHDEEADVYLVSNVNGPATEQDDNGFIARVSPSGKVLDAKWIDGKSPGVTLHAPKGMALSADTLYVVDVDGIRLFDRRTGTQKGSWPIPGATFLNDVTVDDQGRVLVTDTGVEVTPQGPVKKGEYVIYRLDGKGAPERIAQGDALQGPNGIHWSAEGLHFVTFTGRSLMRLEKDGPVEVAQFPKGWCDGLVQLPDGTWLVSSWKGRAVYHVDRSGLPRMIAGGLISPAGLHYDRKRRTVLLPLLQENQVHLLPWDHEQAQPAAGEAR